MLRRQKRVDPSDLWESSDCLLVERIETAGIDAGTREHQAYRHAPVRFTRKAGGDSRLAQHAAIQRPVRPFRRRRAIQPV